MKKNILPKILIGIAITIILVTVGIITSNEATFIEKIQGINNIRFFTQETETNTGTTEDGFKYEILSDGTSISLTGYTGTQTEVVIPEKIENLPVVEIGNYAFEKCTNLTSITIPYGVTNIGDYAFRECSSLTNITIPERVTSIGKCVFSDCLSLTSINVEEANDNYVSIDGILYDKEKTILYCYPAGKNGTDFAIPQGIESIEKYAFWNCDGLTSITIPEGITNIKYMAFYDCTNLSNITIPGTVTNIETCVFSNCYNLTSINVEESNNNYTSIDGILYNKEKTILCCYPAGKSETTFAIPQGIESIEKYAFWACKNLTSIEIPKTTTSIGDHAFSACSNLITINVEESNNNYISIDGILYNKEKTILYYYPAGKRETGYIIPEGITSIGDYAFYSYNNLTRIAIPKEVENIGNMAFEGCKDLTIICIEDSVAKEYAIANNIKYKIVDTIPIIGDINLDNKIDTADLLLLFRHIAASKSETIKAKHPTWILEGDNWTTGDVNEDKVINTTDILKIQRHIAASKSESIKAKHPYWII